MFPGWVSLAGVILFEQINGPLGPDSSAGKVNCSVNSVRDHESRLVATFLTLREDVTGDFARRHLPPFDVEAAAVAKQRCPDAVMDIHGDSEALRVVVVPLPHIGYAAEEWLGIEPALPDLVHDAAPDRRNAVGT